MSKIKPNLFKPNLDYLEKNEDGSIGIVVHYEDKINKNINNVEQLKRLEEILKVNEDNKPNDIEKIGLNYKDENEFKKIIKTELESFYINEDETVEFLANIILKRFNEKYKKNGKSQ